MLNANRMTMARRVTALAALALGSTVMAAGPAAAEPVTGARMAPAAPICSAWALADRVDRTGKIYGSGGVTCKAQINGVLHVALYKNGTAVKHSDPACNYVKSCSTSTGTVTDSSGTQEWCARASLQDLWTDTTYVEWGCITV